MSVIRACHFKRIAYSILAVYVVVLCFTGYKLLLRRINRHPRRVETYVHLLENDDWNPWGEAFDSPGHDAILSNHDDRLWEMERWSVEEARPNLEPRVTNHVYDVEIWGKAAIGIYLWLHILGGDLEQRFSGVWSYGMKEINNIRFRFRTGHGVIPSKVPRDTENLVLVLNGREPSKVDLSKLWLEQLGTLKRLRNVAVVLLGNEACDNDWIKRYMTMNGGIVKLVFVVYDSPDVDDWNFYQWPLGVATYRDFPVVDSAQLPLDTVRRYSCNFMGTVYRNSSREGLVRELSRSSLKDSCYVKARSTWLPKETSSSLNDYLRTLSQSDLTLNPVGVNTECYRIYEAMAYGSVPVIEDVLTPAKCGGKGDKSPLRLLKKFHAPVIYVKDWREINGILRQEKTLTQQDKADRRRDIISWYETFKYQMKDRFVSVLQERFFNMKPRPR